VAKNRPSVAKADAQVAALIEIHGTDDYSQWTGKQITITPAIAPNKKGTITITAHPAAKS